ncbi:hypothetical protein BJY04DRAFT_212627 [Aspergillus karnatakaensis]|uniref:uncharacterized protein n=1 Tax=Aspergillus karnatakaensis TaxID=1810916 RepID=UPI003CCCBCEF
MSSEQSIEMVFLEKPKITPPLDICFDFDSEVSSDLCADAFSALSSVESSDTEMFSNALPGASTFNTPSWPSKQKISDAIQMLKAIDTLLVQKAQKEQTDLEYVMSETEMKHATQATFDVRKQMMESELGSHIHHFNWKGDPVFAHSATPPEVSLWVMLNPPNLQKPALRGYRVETLLYNAMTYVDPVVAKLHPGMPIPRRAKGFIAIMKGRTSKHYTRHGQWVHDKREGEGPYYDHGDAEVYRNPDYRVGNGFIDCEAIKSKRIWDLQQRIVEHKTRARGRTKWRNRQLPVTIEELNHKRYEPSPLRNCVNAPTTYDQVFVGNPQSKYAASI